MSNLVRNILACLLGGAAVGTIIGMNNWVDKIEEQQKQHFEQAGGVKEPVNCEEIFAGNIDLSEDKNYQGVFKEFENISLAICQNNTFILRSPLASASGYTYYDLDHKTAVFNDRIEHELWQSGKVGWDSILEGRTEILAGDNSVIHSHFNAIVALDMVCSLGEDTYPSISEKACALDEGLRADAHVNIRQIAPARNGQLIRK